MSETRKIVIPGSKIGSLDEHKQGRGAFKEGNDIYSYRLGILDERSGYVNVIPLSGIYDPAEGDTVIGVIDQVSKMNWMVNINAPYPAMLRVEEVPWHVEYGAAAKYLNIGDVIMASVAGVNEIGKIDLSMRGKHYRKVEEGIVIDIQSSKVPRVIGRNGSMVSMLRDKTGCRIFVGQNGRVWIKGDDDKLALLVEAIRKIEREAHKQGLTNEIAEFLENEGE
jgi:exosome complex component RRP4